jgi:hypothetical protein
MKRFFAVPFSVLFAALMFTPAAHADWEPGNKDCWGTAIQNYRNEVILQAPSDQAEKRTRDIILESAFLRGWKLVKETPPVLQLQLNVRKHTAVVNVTIKGNKVDINYVSSVNLEYSKDRTGVECIHPKYNSWIANLLKTARTKAQSRN